MTAEPTLDPRQFRDAIGRFATGVTVITWDDGEHIRGMTANAVSSLSLDPMLLLVCVDQKGTAHEQLKAATTFAVNILAQDQMDVSQYFDGVTAVQLTTVNPSWPRVSGLLEVKF